VAAFIDAEHAFDPAYALRDAVSNVDSSPVSDPTLGNKPSKSAETLVRSNAVDIIIVDLAWPCTPCRNRR
jgi:recombination protein RecA